MGTVATMVKGPVKRAAVKAERDFAGKPPLRPAQCRAYMRKELAREFRGIVDGFVKGAKSGSCQHVKLATELLESKKRPDPMRSGRNTLKRLVRRMEQIQD